MLLRTKGDTFAFIDTQRARFSVVSLCRRYQVTPTGFYAWLRRPESDRAKQDRVLSADITRLFFRHRERYGSPACIARWSTPDGRSAAAVSRAS